MPSLFVQDATVGEADRFVDVVVRLDTPASSAISVSYRVANLSTVAGTSDHLDYIPNNGTLNFAPGETSKTVRIELWDNAPVEALEAFQFYLASAVNATISRDTATISIVDNDTVVDVPAIYVDDLQLDEKSGTANFVVRLGHFLGESTANTVTVNYTTSDGTAVAGQDFVAKTGTLTFAPGESVKTVKVDLIDDALAEPLERFGLLLSNPVNARTGDGAATAEIGLSDGTLSSLPRISVADMTVGESDRFANVVVNLHAPSSSAISVSYGVANLSTVAGSNDLWDYIPNNGTLNFAPGETSKTVRIELWDNSPVEALEAFQFYLGSAVNATISRGEATISIVDNDTVVDVPAIYVDDLQLDEKSGTANFVVRLGRQSGESTNQTVAVNFTTEDNTALARQDYIAKSGTLTFAPGESVKTVAIDLIDDGASEPAERFSLLLSSPVNAVLGDGTAVAEVAQSSGLAGAVPRLSVADLTVGEADAAADVVLSLNAASTSPVSVFYFTRSSTAKHDLDFIGSSQTLTFAPGETSKNIRLPIVDDAVAETPETFWFSLQAANNATIGRELATINIIDNDTSVAVPLLFVRDVVVDEKAGTASFVVRLGQLMGESSRNTVTVNYLTTDGTALAGQDYAVNSGVLSFAPGETVKTVVVNLVDDNLTEPLERFNLILSNPVNAVLGDAVAVAEIAGSDAANLAQPRITVDDMTVAESDGFADMVIKLSAPSASTVSVVYGSSDGTARDGADYHAVSGALSFAPGETTKVVRIELSSDGATEGDETVNFLLSSPASATLAASVSRITIIDDDRADGRPLLSQGRSDDIYTINGTAVDFVEAADGGFDVVRSSASFALPATLEGVILTGTAANATGHDGANFFQGNAASNTLDGRGGIDTVAFAGSGSDYDIAGSTTSRTVARNGEGSDVLLSIERLQFADTVLAYDTAPGGNTWGAFALLNAAFDSYPDASLLGQWTAQLDRLGGSLDELAREMIQFYAPGIGNEPLVAYLWSTVVETPITPADLAGYVGLIENGTYTQASLTVLAATHPLNTDEFVQLVGQPMVMDPAWFPLPGG